MHLRLVNWKLAEDMNFPGFHVFTFVWEEFIKNTEMS